MFHNSFLFPILLYTLADNANDLAKESLLLSFIFRNANAFASPIFASSLHRIQTRKSN